MMIWPDWTKLYDKGQCLAYWVPFSDEQQTQIDEAETQAEKEALVREFREEYQKKLKEEHTTLEKKPEEDEKIESLKVQILELNPEATFKNPTVAKLEKELEKLKKLKEEQKE